MSPALVPDEWQPALAALRALPFGSVALLVGATDRGKTTFTALAAQTLSGEYEAANERVAIVDADIGQGEIGPPGTVGVAWAKPSTVKLAELSPLAVHFVGAFAPNSAALELVACTGRAVGQVQHGARCVLVDTTGWVSGPAARRVKIAKAQTVAPSLVVGFGPEVETLLSALGSATGAATLLVNTPPTMGRKTQAVRSTRRLTRLSRALEGAGKGASELALPLSQVATVGATLGTGTVVAPQLVRWAGEALRVGVVYGETNEGALNLWTFGPLPRFEWEQNAGPVAAHFGARTVRLFSLALYNDVYVGLTDVSGRTLGVGRFTGFDVERATLLVTAPHPATSERVRLLTFGRVRLKADGSYIGEVKPGEL